MYDRIINSKNLDQLLYLRDSLKREFLAEDDFVTLKRSKSFNMANYEGMINRISFIVEDNCNINGIDCRGNLYVGRLGPNFKIILFKFMGQEIYPQCFLGTFNMKNRCLDGVWSSNVNVSDILEKINTWGRNSDRLAYLVNENLDGVNILIERAYKNVFNSPWSSGRDRDLISQLKGIQYYQRKYK